MNESKEKFQYYKLYKAIIDRIESGEFDTHNKLPTEKEFQTEYKVSRDTVRKALSKLEYEGYIDRKSALGTFIKKKKFDYELSSMLGFSEQMISRGITPSSELESIILTTDIKESIREKLSLKETDKCYVITRTRKGNDIPIAYEIIYTPFKLCPNIHKYIDEYTSVYDVYENVFKHELGIGTIRLDAEMPNKKISSILQIPKDSPVLMMKCLVLLKNSDPLYYVECSYLGEKYFFSTTIKR